MTTQLITSNTFATITTATVTSFQHDHSGPHSPKTPDPKRCISGNNQKPKRHKCRLLLAIHAALQSYFPPSEPESDGGFTIIGACSGTVRPHPVYTQIHIRIFTHTHIYIYIYTHTHIQTLLGCRSQQTESASVLGIHRHPKPRADLMPHGFNAGSYKRLKCTSRRTLLTTTTY